MAALTHIDVKSKSDHGSIHAEHTPPQNDMKTAIAILLISLPNLTSAEILLLKSDEFKFIWPVSSNWETTQSLTKGQYAIKHKGDKLMTLVLYVFPDNKMTLAALLNSHRQDSQYLFRGTKTRFPESKFISSSVVKLGSHDSV